MSLRFVFFSKHFLEENIDIYLLISDTLLEFLSIHDMFLTYADAQTLRVHNFLEPIPKLITNIIQNVRGFNCVLYYMCVSFHKVTARLQEKSGKLSL